VVVKFLSIITFAVVLTTVGCTPKTTQEHLKTAIELRDKAQYNKAIIELKNALLAAPKDKQTRLELGNIYLLASQFANAEKELRLAKDLGEDKNIYFPLLLKSIYYQNDFNRAFLLSNDFESNDVNVLSTVSLFHYLSYLRDEPDNTQKVEFPPNLLGDDMLIALAYQALAAKNPSDSQSYISQFSNTESEIAEKAMLSALTNTSLGNTTDAINNYKTLISIFPEYYIARFQLTELLIYIEDLANAETQAKYLYALNTRGAYANLLLSKISFKQDKFEPALSYAEQAILNGMNNLEANFLAGVSAYKNGKIETARHYLTKVTSSLPSNHVANKILAEVNLKLGYTEEALKQIESFDLNSKSKATVLSNAAIQQFQLGNFLKAKEFISEANQADPENAVNLLKEGFIKLSSDDGSGLKNLTEAIKYDTSINEAWLLIAETHLKKGELKAAFDIAKKWQETNLIDGLSLEGYINLQTNNIEDAKTIFKKILDIEPQHIGASRFLMMISAREGDFSTATIISKKLIIQNPSQLSTVLTYVNIGIAENRIEEVQKFLDELIKNTIDIQAPIIAQALIYAWQKKPEQAINYLNKLADQNNSQVLMVKGDLYRSINKLNEAYEQYDTWTSLYPKEANGWFRKLDLLQTRNDMPTALQTSIEALNYFPNEPRFKALNARYLLNAGKVEDARRQYNTVKKYEYQLPTLKLFNAEIALQENKYREAKQLLSEFYAEKPDFEVAKLLAQAMQELGEAKEGGILLEQELAKLANPFVQIHAVAEYYARNGLLEKSAEIYFNLLKKYPQHYITINNYAAVLIRQGEIDKAFDLANVAIQLRPQSGYSLDLYGWVLFKQAKYAEALSYISKANDLLPQNTEIQMHLVEVLFVNNEKIKAQSLLKQIVPITKAEKTALQDLRLKLKT
jgi:putative PEP-CTERM system TPR-repeat lipoprotein